MGDGTAIADKMKKNWNVKSTFRETKNFEYRDVNGSLRRAESKE